MKTFTVYLDTKTGRSQVTVEADRFELSDHGFDFFREDTRVAHFTKTGCFGVLEELHAASWEEESPAGAL